MTNLVANYICNAYSASIMVTAALEALRHVGLCTHRLSASYFLDVNRLRILLLVLLAVLLPIRGAVAASMLCPEGGGTSTTQAVGVHEHHGVHAGQAMQSDHSAARHHVVADGANSGSSSNEHPASCHFCASGCCMASMVVTVPSLSHPGLTSTVMFPALTAPIPTFHSGGQDRPPRTI